MNRTMLSVVALAVGAVLIIGLYNIYNPQIKGMTHDVFDKIHVQRMVGNDAQPQKKNNQPHVKPTEQQIEDFSYMKDGKVTSFSYEGNNMNDAKAIISQNNLDMGHPYRMDAEPIGDHPSKQAEGMAKLSNMSDNDVYFPYGTSEADAQKQLSEKTQEMSKAIAKTGCTFSYKPITQADVAHQIQFG